MTYYLNIMYHFEEGLMADERKLNEQPSINKDYYYYYYYYITAMYNQILDTSYYGLSNCVYSLSLFIIQRF